MDRIFSQSRAYLFAAFLFLVYQAARLLSPFLKVLYEVIPLPESQKGPVAHKFHETMYAVIYGILLISLVEGIVIL